MSEDHLDSETSISAELTETGVKASAKSRAVSSMDRLLGGAVDLGSAWLEGVAQRRRAKNEGERQLIDAAVRYGLDRMNLDDEFAKRAFEGHFKKIGRQQINKDAVVAEALEDLRTSPPSEQQASNGPSTIDEEFMDAFERYAEDASSDELRQRWGRVLSAEIRKPGTFSAKVLRATDELDAPTAAIFERLSASRINRNAIAISIAGTLAFHEKISLISAGLIADPGIAGHLSVFTEAFLSTGEPFWYLSGDSIGIGIMKSNSISFGNGNSPLTNHDGRPAVPVYILTDVGRALCSILPYNEREVFRSLGIRLKVAVSGGEILYFRQGENGHLEGLPSLV